jgi:hypothetical protein
MNASKAVHWLARTTVGNAVAIALGIILSLVSAAFAAEMTRVDAPATEKVVQQFVDTSTEPDAPSVNLTPNDPGYMSTAPGASAAPAPAAEVPAPESTTAAATPTETTQTAVAPVTTPTEAAPPSTPQAAPVSPQANPNIIPLVIAWDGLKCPKPDSYHVQTRDGAMLMCPGSIQP